ncbi:ZN638 protein, partial [Spelaeornis formosus]|nr:ZN638 protein [Elachura formosa]
PGPVPVLEQNSNPQNRYTPESASSILASFGLSNEDLEELSRYPDDQLTPENMPRILREIRIRKLGHAVPGLHAPSRGDEPVGESSGTAIKGKVIDYGHASKYGYTEDPLEIRTYNPEVLPEEPLEARVYNPESSSAENREEFQREQSVPVAVPPPNVPCNPVFPAEDLIKLPVFPTDSSAAPPFFPAEPPAKVPGLCGTAPAALPVVKQVSQPPMPPVLPPMLPVLLPTPLPQPMLPPLMPPLVQPPVSQHVCPPMTTPPFSAGLLAAISQHEQKQRDPGSTHPTPGATGGASAGHKPYHKPFHPPAEEPIKSPFGVVKASWLPVFPDSQKSKRLPTPSMMNDYYATSPRIFPHLCSLCNLECTHMKDWILHQNNPAHLESCRRLRQQYPEWNPEAHSSNRNGAERKENRTPKHRSSSCSPSRRRSRPCSPGRGSAGSGHSGHSSGHSLRRYRSRSRSPGRFRRPRSRSPRHIRRLSPRHRSRSPQRSRNPLRPSPRPRRSPSSEHSSRRSSRSEDRKAALEAVMKTLGPGFLAEFKKHKSLQAAVQESLASGKSHGIPSRTTGSVRKPLRNAPKISRKDGSAVAGPSSEVPGLDFWEFFPYFFQLLREDLLSCGTVLQISDLPDDGFSDQDIKKLVQPFGKVSDLIVLRSRNEAYLEMNYKEAVIAAVKFGETAPVLLNGKRVRISVAERPQVG